MPITHAKVLTGPDGTNPDRAQPSDWNDDHDLTGLVAGDLPSLSSIYLPLAGGTMAGALNLGSTGQLVFPATQNPSAGANTLDDYEEGTWTSGLTFSTPGDLSVAYSSQDGSYTRIGRLVFVYARLQTSTWTHTTASGDLRLTGLPFAIAGGHYPVFEVNYQGWTESSIEWLSVRAASGATHLEFIVSRSGSTSYKMGVTEALTATTQVVFVSGCYHA